MTISDTSLLCGLWSYQKYANVPHIQEEQEISIEDCKLIATKKKFKTPSGSIGDIDIMN